MSDPFTVNTATVGQTAMQAIGRCQRHYDVWCPTCDKTQTSVPAGLPGGPALCGHPSAGYVFTTRTRQALNPGEKP